MKRIEHILLPPNVPNAKKGWAYVKVSNIPVMTDENKDELNKQLLFAIVDKPYKLNEPGNNNFIGVYHRYLQPDWPNGPWHPTWRIEAGTKPEQCRREWSIWNSSPLNEVNVVFGVAWDMNKVWVMHMDSGHVQNLTIFGQIGLGKLATPDEELKWGWHSECSAKLIDLGTMRKGNPILCG